MKRLIRCLCIIGVLLSLVLEPALGAPMFPADCPEKHETGFSRLGPAPTDISPRLPIHGSPEEPPTEEGTKASPSNSAPVVQSSGSGNGQVAKQNGGTKPSPPTVPKLDKSSPIQKHDAKPELSKIAPTAPWSPWVLFLGKVITVTWCSVLAVSAALFIHIVYSMVRECRCSRCLDCRKSVDKKSV